MGVNIDAPRAELEGREAPVLVQTVEFLLRRRRIRGRIDTGIDLDTVAHFAAQQLVDGHARRLGCEVPEAMIERRDCRQTERSGWKTVLLEQEIIEILHPCRVLPGKESIEVVQHRRQGEIGAVIVTFTPAGQTVIGIESDDDAGAVLVAGDEYPHAIDFHASVFLMNCSLRQARHYRATAPFLTSDGST